MIPLPGSFLAVTLLFLALAAPAHEDLELQIARLTRRIEERPSDARLWFRRAELHRLHRDGPPARADYARARDLDPALAEVDLGLGRLARAEGRLGDAVRHLGDYLERRPDDGAGFVERARARAALGAWDLAWKDYDAALAKLQNPPPDLHVERARAIRSAGAAAEGLRAVDEATRHFGPLVTLVTEAVDMELADGRPERALSRIELALEGGGRNERWHLRRGEILQGMGRAGAAREAYAKALRQIEDLPPARRRTRETSALENDLRARIQSLEATR